MKNIQALGSLKSLGSRGSAGGIQYLLQDTFSTDLAAGSVNGTNAEPTGGARTVVDASNNLSLSGGLAVFNTNAPGIWYSTQARIAGKTLIQKLNITSGNVRTGFGSNQTTVSILGAKVSPTAIIPNDNAIGSANIGTLVSGTDYQIATVIRTSGLFLFIKGGTFTNWTLLWVGNINATANLFPGALSESGAIFTGDNFRIPSNLYLPTPLAYDTFTRANGVIGSTESSGPDSQNTPILVWTGSTWTVSSNVALNTPVTLGAENFVDPGLETWTNPTTLTNWTQSVAGTSTINQETVVFHGGSNAARMDIDGTNSNASITQILTLGAGKWVQISVWMRSSATGKTGVITTTMHSNGVALDPGTTYTQYINTDLTSAGAITYGVKRTAATSGSLYFDDISLKILTLSELIASISTSTKDIIADVNITQAGVKGIQAGVVINLDSTSSPANFVIAYLDGYGNATLQKCVAGTYTSVISAAITYVAGATLRVIKDGTNYQLFYNNLKVGSTSTISDAGIISNTLHGLFSTYSGNTLDNFTLFPRGSTNNEFATLDSY